MAIARIVLPAHNLAILLSHDDMSSNMLPLLYNEGLCRLRKLEDNSVKDGLLFTSLQTAPVSILLVNVPHGPGSGSASAASKAAMNRRHLLVTDVTRAIWRYSTRCVGRKDSRSMLVVCR